jgi:16S rRNA (uracil1498-N3)-methyltransferase
MQTFIYNSKERTGNTIIVTGSEARHISQVMRLKKGGLVRLIDGAGSAHTCEILRSGMKTVTCRVIKSTKNAGEASADLTLATGLSAGSKFDAVIEKGTEVGINRFVPLLTRKGKVRIADGASLNRKLTRWRRVAEAAAKQSSRSVIPRIELPLDYGVFIKSVAGESAILFHPDDRVINLKSILDSARGREVTLIIGPESGFAPEELEQAREKNIRFCSLGPRILRTEPAGVVLAALVIYYLETVNP